MMMNLKDWLSTHFTSNLDFCEILELLYFTPKGCVPDSIYNFNTRIEWAELKKVFTLLCQNHNIKRPVINTCVIVSLPQLLDHQCMQALYYMFGYYFSLFIIAECELFLKWGSDSYIRLADFKSDLDPQIPKYCYSKFYRKTLLIQSTGYNKDLSLKMFRMLYCEKFRKKSELLVSVQSPDDLKSRILETYVGQEICEDVQFEKNDSKILFKILAQNPSLKKCQKLLYSIIESKEKIVPVSKVIQFITKVLVTYVPCYIFGHKKHFKKYIRNIQQLLKFTRRQEGTLGFLLKGVIRKCELWRRNLLAKIASWIFHSFVIGVLRDFFYVSEIDKDNSLVFVKKIFWINYMKESLQSMIEMNQLVEVPKPTTKGLIRRLRFLPKLHGSGYRPVIRKSAWDTMNEEKLEICNVFLKQVIACKCNKYPQHINDLQKSWSNFLVKKNKLKSFYVKTDIKDAFGSIIQEKLKDILNLWFEGLPENLELLCFSFKGRFGKEEFLQQFVNLQPSIGKKILTYQPGKDKIISLTELKNLIFHYIDNIIISSPAGKKCYRLCKGLHQGGKLSAALCEAYYSALDKKYFSSIYDSLEGDLFLRAVDDYIFISKSKERISKFLEIALTGIPEYGVEVQLEKTVSNVGHRLLTQSNILEASVIPFFGFCLDIEKGFIKPNMDKYKSVNIRSSLFFKKLDASILEAKITYIHSLKLQNLVLNPEYQTKKILFETIHTATCLQALKFVSITHFLSLAEVKLDEEFLMECILRGISAIAKNSSCKARPMVQFPEAKKTCIKSFILILSKKKCFSKLVEGLHKEERKIHIFSKRNVKIIKRITKEIHPSLVTTYDSMGI